ncbi:MAG: response regulator transcription factor [bacterium]|nr:response regulator transcription factor [bacterium]
MKAAEPIVFVVDDDASVCKALDRLIRSVGLKAETFPSAKDFLRREPHNGPSCLVLDIRMPGLSGLDLQRELAAKDYSIPIIFITGHGDIPMSVQAMKAGAVDFLPKPFSDQELLDAIHAALEKDTLAREERAELSNIQRRIGSLTPREHEVFVRVVTGMLNKQIAWELGASEKTIKVHRARVMEKMGVQSVAELVHLAEKAGIPTPKV